MDLTKYIERFDRLHRLISRKATGSPAELASKLNLSERATYEYISAMRDMGAPIAYCHCRRTYYYEREVQFYIGFRELTKDEIGDIEGGTMVIGSNYFTKFFLLQ